MPEVEIGSVSDFFAHPVVAGIELIDGLKVGDKIHIMGHTTDIELAVDSMQIDNKPGRCYRHQSQRPGAQRRQGLQDYRLKYYPRISNPFLLAGLPFQWHLRRW